MSLQNVETVRRGYEAWNRGDLDAVRAIYAPDVTANAGGLWTAAGELSGPEAIIEAFASIRATFQNSELVPDEYIERGASVVVPTRWRGTLAESQNVIEQRVVAAYTLRAGQIVHIGYFDRLDDAFAGTAEWEDAAPGIA
jgi:ketosteroid isomerase-like protein